MGKAGPAKGTRLRPTIRVDGGFLESLTQCMRDDLDVVKHSWVWTNVAVAE